MRFLSTVKIEVPLFVNNRSTFGALWYIKAPSLVVVVASDGLLNVDKNPRSALINAGGCIDDNDEDDDDDSYFII